MNHYYAAGPPPPSGGSPNGFYNGYSRRQHGPPAHHMGQPSMQPNPYAPPFIPIAAQPIHSSPLNTPRPPTIVSSSYMGTPAPMNTPPLPPPHPSMHMQMSSHIMPPQPMFQNSIPFQQHYEYAVPPRPLRVVNKTPKYPQPGVLPWLSCPHEPFPERPRRKRRNQPMAREKDEETPTMSKNGDLGEIQSPVSHPITATATVTDAKLEKEQEHAEEAVNGNVVQSQVTEHTSNKVAEVPTPDLHASNLQETAPTSSLASETTTAPPVPTATVSSQSPVVSNTDTIVNATQDENTTESIAAKPAPKSVPETVPAQPSAPAPNVPKSWADLVKSQSKPGGNAPPVAKPNGGPAKTSLSDILKNFDGGSLSISVPILEPRGIKNTGNMCYMNAILQVLIFCAPFYNFLDMLGKNMTHSFKGNTPLLDTMIMLLREFKVLGDKASIEKLHGFKAKEYLESFGDPFTPELLYSALKDIQRFASMRRGHQQDAEEFLGFLLDELHEELVKVIKASTETAVSSPAMSEVSDDGWLEVGPKQKTASTRTTTIIESPITRLFGGKLRSEFKIAGSKPSVTLEPYQPLQLDIQSPQVQNIVDALKQLTKPETVHGDFKGRNGANTTGTKTVYIETLPPVLILHLKRFQYDNKGGTQKIWKKIGYPLILDFPKEAMSPQKRQNPAAKFKLTGVVYHHGKSASGGHYTVDVLRQDEKNWIRLDDTTIKKVHADEVRVDVKELGSSNFSDQADSDTGWESVGNGSSDYAGAVNGNVNYNKDSKVAYILFYQRI